MPRGSIIRAQAGEYQGTPATFGGEKRKSTRANQLTWLYVDFILRGSSFEETTTT